MSNYYTSKISVKYSARKLVPLRPTNKRAFAMSHGERRNFDFEVGTWSCLSSGQRLRKVKEILTQVSLTPAPLHRLYSSSCSCHPEGMVPATVSAPVKWEHHYSPDLACFPEKALWEIHSENQMTQPNWRKGLKTALPIPMSHMHAFCSSGFPSITVSFSVNTNGTTPARKP